MLPTYPTPPRASRVFPNFSGGPNPPPPPGLPNAYEQPSRFPPDVPFTCLSQASIPSRFVNQRNLGMSDGLGDETGTDR